MYQNIPKSTLTFNQQEPKTQNNNIYTTYHQQQQQQQSQAQQNFPATINLQLSGSSNKSGNLQQNQGQIRLQEEQKQVIKQSNLEENSNKILEQKEKLRADLAIQKKQQQSQLQQHFLQMLKINVASPQITTGQIEFEEEAQTKPSITTTTTTNTINNNNNSNNNNSNSKVPNSVQINQNIVQQSGNLIDLTIQKNQNIQGIQQPERRQQVTEQKQGIIPQQQITIQKEPQKPNIQNEQIYKQQPVNTKQFNLMNNNIPLQSGNLIDLTPQKIQNTQGVKQSERKEEIPEQKQEIVINLQQPQQKHIVQNEQIPKQQSVNSKQQSVPQIIPQQQQPQKNITLDELLSKQQPNNQQSKNEPLQYQQQQQQQDTQKLIIQNEQIPKQQTSNSKQQNEPQIIPQIQQQYQQPQMNLVQNELISKQLPINLQQQFEPQIIPQQKQQPQKQILQNDLIANQQTNNLQQQNEPQIIPQQQYQQQQQPQNYQQPQMNITQNELMNKQQPVNSKQQNEPQIIPQLQQLQQQQQKQQYQQIPQNPIKEQIEQKQIKEIQQINQVEQIQQRQPINQNYQQQQQVIAPQNKLNDQEIIESQKQKHHYSVSPQKTNKPSNNIIQSEPHQNKQQQQSNINMTKQQEIIRQQQQQQQNKNQVQRDFPKQTTSPKQNQTQMNSGFKTTSKSNEGRRPERQSYNNNNNSSEDLLRQQFYLLTSTKKKLNPDEKSKLIEALTSPKNSKVKSDFLQMNSQGQQELIHRLLSSSEAQYEEKKTLIEYYMQEELKECTFQPKISGNHEQERRSFNQFLEDQQTFKAQQEQRKMQLKQEKDDIQAEQSLNRPQISEKSKAILEGKRSSGVGVHQRLYQEGLQMKQQKLEQANLFSQDSDIFLTKEQRQTVRLVQDEEATFTPQIHQKSQKIQRDQKIEDILYQDAVRRLNKNEQKSVIPRTENKLSMNSQVLLARKLLKELYIVFQQIIPTLEQQRQISYEKIAEVMQRMGYLLNFTKEEENVLSYQEKTLLYDMWLVLRGEEQNYITRRNLIVFLFGILGLSFNIHVDNDQVLDEIILENNNNNNDKGQKALVFEDQFFNVIYNELGNILNNSNHNKIDENFNQIQNQNLKKEILGEDQYGNKVKVSIGQFDEEGNIYLSEQDFKKIQKVYDTFYINRLNSEKNKKNQPKNNNEQLPSYKPEILEISKNLAANYRYKLIEGTQQLLLRDVNTQNIQLQLTHADLLVIQKKAQKLAHEQARNEQEQSILEECTFKPQTISYINSNGNNNNNNNNNRQQQQQLRSEIIEEAEFESKISNYKKNAMPTQSLGKHRAFELYQLSKPSSQKRDRDPNEIEYEKNCDECTFTPDITITKNKKSSNTSSVEIIAKNVDKTIERLKKGREMKEYKEFIKDKGVTQNGDFSAYQQHKNKQQQQQQHISSKNTSVNQSVKQHKINNKQNNNIQNNNNNNIYKQNQQQSNLQNYQQQQKNNNKNIDVQQNYQGYNLQTKQNLPKKTEVKGRYDQEQQEQIYEHSQNNLEEDEEQQQVQSQQQYSRQISEQIYENDYEDSAENVKKQHTDQENEEEIEDRAPLLFVDVNLGVDRAERIVVYEGDSAEELAENFGNLHNLDEDMKKRLRDLLNTQINSLLQRIDEETVSHQSEEDYNKYHGENEDDE